MSNLTRKRLVSSYPEKTVSSSSQMVSYDPDAAVGDRVGRINVQDAVEAFAGAAFAPEGTTAQIEAGTDQGTKVYSPETMNDAINSLVESAVPDGTAAQIIAGTNTTERKYTPSDLNAAIKSVSATKYDSIADIEAITGQTSGDSVYLSLGGRSGVFQWDSSDLSTEVAVDTLQGVYIAPSSDATGASGAWTRRINGFVTPEMFGSTGLVGDSSDASVQAAFDSGFPVKGVWGSVYRFDSTVSKLNGSIDFDIGGAEIIQNGDFEAISISNEFTDIQPVSTITTGSIDLRNGDSASLTEVAVLSVSDGSAYEKGDIVKVLSDDLLPETDPSDSQRTAEFAKVSGVSGNDVYLYSILREEYSTSIRIAKMASQYDVKIYNGKLNADSSVNPTYSAPLISISGCFEPLVSVKTDNTRAELLELISCLSPKTYNLSAKAQTTSFANFAYGYTIAEYSCEGGVHISPSAYDARHVYTTGAKAVSTSGDVSLYGRTRDFRVVNGYGFNCQNSAFDTHPDAEGGVFESCVARQPYNGPNGTQRNYQLRGKGGRIVNCQSFGGTGYHVFAEYAAAGAAKNNHIINCHHEYLPGVQNLRYAFSIEGQAGFPVECCRIVNPTTNQPSGKAAHVYSVNADVVVESPAFNAAQTGIGDSLTFYAESSKITVNGGYIDYSGATDTNIRVCHVSTDDSEILLNGTRIASDSPVYLSRMNTDSGNDAGAFIAKGVVTNLPLKEFNSTYDIGLTNVGAGAYVSVGYSVNGSRSVDAGAFLTTFNALGDKSISLRARGHERLVASVSLSVAGTANINNIDSGSFVGQVLTIRVDSGSTGDFTIDSTGTNIDIGSTETIAVGKSYTMIFDGTNWVSS